VRIAGRRMHAVVTGSWRRGGDDNMIDRTFFTAR